MIQPDMAYVAQSVLDITNEQREGASFWCDVDDFAGSYENAWYQSQGYGIGPHYVSGPPYLKIWYTIEEW